LSAKSIFIVTASIFGAVFLSIFLSTIIFEGPSPDSEVISSSSTQKELKITGTVGSGVISTYTVVVSGSATVGGLSNPSVDQVSADGKTITGLTRTRSTDNYFFTGDIVSIVADQKMTTTVDGVKFPNSTPNLVTES